MTTLNIPDLGGASQVEVIEVLVKEGDSVDKEQALIVLETDKASMEIPAEQAGVVARLLIKVGDKVSEGDAFIELEGGAAKAAAPVAETAPAPVQTAPVKDEPVAAPAAAAVESVTVSVPDLGGAAEVDVI